MEAREREQIIQKVKELQKDILALPVYDLETHNNIEAAKLLQKYIVELRTL